METAEISLHLRAARAAAALSYLGDRALAAVGLSMDEYEILEAIARKRGRTSIACLARELGMKRTGLSRRMLRLEKQSLIRLDRWSASRTDPVLTLTGHNALAMLEERWKEVEAHVRERLGPALPGVIDALRRLTDPALGAEERVAPFPGEFIPPRPPMDARTAAILARMVAESAIADEPPPERGGA